MAFEPGCGAAGQVVRTPSCFSDGPLVVARHGRRPGRRSSPRHRALARAVLLSFKNFPPFLARCMASFRRATREPSAGNAHNSRRALAKRTLLATAAAATGGGGCSTRSSSLLPRFSHRLPSLCGGPIPTFVGLLRLLLAGFAREIGDATAVAVAVVATGAPATRCLVPATCNSFAAARNRAATVKSNLASAPAAAVEANGGATATRPLAAAYRRRPQTASAARRITRVGPRRRITASRTHFRRRRQPHLLPRRKSAEKTPRAMCPTRLRRMREAMAEMRKIRRSAGWAQRRNAARNIWRDAHSAGPDGRPEPPFRATWGRGRRPRRGLEEGRLGSVHIHRAAAWRRVAATIAAASSALRFIPFTYISSAVQTRTTARRW